MLVGNTSDGTTKVVVFGPNSMKRQSGPFSLLTYGPFCMKTFSGACPHLRKRLHNKIEEVKALSSFARTRLARLLQFPAAVVLAAFMSLQGMPAAQAATPGSYLTAP